MVYKMLLMAHSLTSIDHTIEVEMQESFQFAFCCLNCEINCP